MQEDNKTEVLNKPEIIRRESMVRGEPAVKAKSRKWIFNLILMLVIIGLILYLFTHPEGIQNWVNNFFEKLLK